MSQLKEITPGHKRVYVNCFRCQKSRFFPRRTFWRTEQTQVEFVEFEERLIGEKMAFIGSGMNSHTPSKAACHLLGEITGSNEDPAGKIPK